MFSAKKMFMTGVQKPELHITIQPVDKESVNGNARLSVSAATTGSKIKYRWYKYTNGMGPPELVLEEIK